MNTFRRFLALFALVSLAAFAQLTTPSTTLSTALSASSNTVKLASATGIILPSISASGTILYVDTEAMQVSSTAGGTTYTVKRGQYGTRQTAHASGALVWVTQAATNSGDLSRPFSGGALVSGSPSGTCVASAQYTLPVINPTTGQVSTCWSGVWQPINQSVPASILGTAVASATTIAPTAHTFHVTGTTTVQTITVPAGFAPGGCFTIIPDAIFATGTSGNIALASTGVVSKALRECWDGQKFYPSY